MEWKKEKQSEKDAVLEVRDLHFSYNDEKHALMGR